MGLETKGGEALANGSSTVNVMWICSCLMCAYRGETAEGVQVCLTLKPSTLASIRRHAAARSETEGRS